MDQDLLTKILEARSRIQAVEAEIETVKEETTSNEKVPGETSAEKPSAESAALSRTKGSAVGTARQLAGTQFDSDTDLMRIVAARAAASTENSNRSDDEVDETFPKLVEARMMIEQQQQHQQKGSPPRPCTTVAAAATTVLRPPMSQMQCSGSISKARRISGATEVQPGAYAHTPSVEFRAPMVRGSNHRDQHNQLEEQAPIPFCRGLEDIETEMCQSNHTANTTSLGSSNIEEGRGGTEQPFLLEDSVSNLAVAKAVEEEEDMESLVLSLPLAHEYDSEDSDVGHDGNRQGRQTTKYLFYFACGGLFVAVAVVVALILWALLGGSSNSSGDFAEANDNSHINDAQSDLSSPLNLTVLPYDILQLVENDPASPQALSYQWLLADPHASTYSPNRLLQRFALATLYYATSEIHAWTTATNWLSYDQNECFWFSAASFGGSEEDGESSGTHASETAVASLTSPCNDKGLYERLWLRANGLHGTLPEEIFWLSSLTSLSLDYNKHLMGSIPTSVGKLSRLQELALGVNQLTGTIPTELTLLTDLQHMQLHVNALTGSIPAHIASMTSLKDLVLYGNLLSGLIPTELGTLSMLSGLFLDENALTGDIPTEIGALSGLVDLWLSRNMLVSRLPRELCNLSHLSSLILFENSFSGSIPSSFGSLTALQTLKMNSNAFTGTIPSELVGLTALEVLDMHSNMLSSTLPTHIGFLSAIRFLDLSYNMFQGSIPSELGQATSLSQGLILKNNANLSGRLPSELGSLTALQRMLIAHTALTGSIPTTLGRMSAMEELDIHDNILTSTLPTEICHLGALRTLKLYKNMLTSTLPSELGLLSSVQLLDISDNDFRGIVPTELGLLGGLSWGLHLSESNLSGPIPSQLGSLSNLESLWLQMNKLTGTVPLEVLALAFEDFSLDDFDITGNADLAGTIPEELCSVDAMGYAMLFDCSPALCGCGCTCGDAKPGTTLVIIDSVSP